MTEQTIDIGAETPMTIEEFEALLAVNPDLGDKTITITLDDADPTDAELEPVA